MTSAGLPGVGAGISKAEMLKLSDAERRLVDNHSPVDRELRVQTLTRQILQLEQQPKTPQYAIQRATLCLEVGGLQLDLDEKDSAWNHVKPIISVFLDQQKFESAALAAQYLYLCDKEDAISAIGQAAWLAVTYPVDPQLTVTILDHIVDETPDKSDGAAVAAATAHYVVDVRCSDEDREQLKLFTGSMLARVARRHSNVETQEQFERWVKVLELDEPDKFLVRLRNVIDVMVQEDWYFDREALTNALPDAATGALPDAATGDSGA